MERMTIDQFRSQYGSRQSGKGNKYHAKKVGGHASQKEHDRASQLRLMQHAGLISDLREQVTFELIPAQYRDLGRDPKGKPVRELIEKGCRYRADFVYKDAAGQTVVEDTKGFRTKEYVIKRKLMLWVHGIKIKET